MHAQHQLNSVPAQPLAERLAQRRLRPGNDAAAALDLDRLAGTQQRLRRNASPVRALAADQLTLDERDPQPAHSQRGGAVLAGSAAAEHDHVIVAAHVGNSSPARSAAMYAAYQSGQSS